MMIAESATINPELQAIFDKDPEFDELTKAIISLLFNPHGIKKRELIQIFKQDWQVTGLEVWLRIRRLCELDILVQSEEDWGMGLETIITLNRES